MNGVVLHVCVLMSRREVYSARASLVSVYVLPVSFDDALGDGVADLVENVSVVCTADEELILKEQQTIISSFEQQKEETSAQGRKMTLDSKSFVA